VLRPIRRVIPLIAGVDLSPLILILVLMFLRNLLFEYLVFR
jgi:YggT family protein